MIFLILHRYFIYKDITPHTKDFFFFQKISLTVKQMCILVFLSRKDKFRDDKDISLNYGDILL